MIWQTAMWTAPAGSCLYFVQREREEKIIGDNRDRHGTVAVEAALLAEVDDGEKHSLLCAAVGHLSIVYSFFCLTCCLKLTMERSTRCCARQFATFVCSFIVYILYIFCVMQSEVRGGEKQAPLCSWPPFRHFFKVHSIIVCLVPQGLWTT